MDPIVNRPTTTQPFAFTPAARPAAAGVGDIAPVAAPEVQLDTNRVETGGLAGALGRATVAEYVPAADVPTRSKPADPPTPRENFKQAASETLLYLNKLAGFFDGTAQLEPASQPLYLRLGGLSEAIGDRLFNYMDKTTMSQDQLLTLLKTVDGIRKKFEDEKFKPNPSTEEGRREIDSLFTQLDSALLIPHGDAKPPSLSTNFKQAAMEEIAVLNKIVGSFDPIAQLEPDSQPMFRKMAGLLEALNDRVSDLRNPSGMRQEDLLTVLKAIKEIRAKIDDKDYKVPNARTPEGRKEIEALFNKIPTFVSYKSADPPTERQNFKQAASDALLYLNKLGGFFDATAQLDPASQPLFLRMGGLTEALGDRLYNFMDTTTMSQDQLLRVLKSVEEVRKKFENKDFKPNPSTEEGRREIDSLFTQLDSALLVPHGDAKPPSLASNFKQAAMEEIALLNKLVGFFDPIAQLEPDSQPMFRKIAGLLEAVNDRVNDLRNPAGMRQDDLLTVLKATKEIRAKFDDKDFKAPNARTPEGRQQIEALFNKLPTFVAFKSADPPTPRHNFMSAAMESLSILNKVNGYFDDFARLEDPSKALYERVGGLLGALNDRTLNYYDKTGLDQDQLLRVLKAAEEIRAKTNDDKFKPDPKTADGRREIDSLFTKLDSALALPNNPSPPPSLQDNFRQGGMEAISVLNRLSGVFGDLTRLEAETQPMYLKLGGLINTVTDRLFGHNRLGALHPANLTALLRTTQAIRDALADKSRTPDPKTADGRSKIDGFVTNLANQIGLPFA